MVEASLVNLAELGVLVVGVVIALQQLNARAAVGSPCIMVWEKIRPLVYRERERMSSQYGTASRYLTSFEYLYEAIKEHRASL